ncbi:hypothetical protein HNY73_012252 [Argiope bruennichi]|uniref:Uncharacterized protein n=1 Tax=Argiope bruennichi TaxID=94029 RepID=A0A8T0EUX5_ARGBR|nr:hypothetical protein HNY73_012252 [Argiope bruennichi]
MKIQKKNAVEDETALVQLERRHTLKEDTNEVDLEDNLRKTTRANSLGGFEEGRLSTDIEAVNTKKQSKCTRKPTVITESELSSSSLYKDRKAKINSDDESIEDPRSTKPPENHEDLEPRTLRDPNLKPVPVSQRRPRKKSSCCWYFTIVLVILIACLAVMAGIGGIVFMEFFATYDVADTGTLVKNDGNPSASKDNFQHPSHRQDNSPDIPENILTDFIKNSTLFSLDSDVSRKTIVITSQSVEDSFQSPKLTNTKDSKGKELNKNKNNFVFENQGTKMAQNPSTAEHSDFSRNINNRINNLNLPVSDKFVAIKTTAKNQDLVEIKSNDQNINHIMNKTPDADESNKEMFENGNIMEEKSNSEGEAKNASEEMFLPKRNFDEMTSLKNTESRTEHGDSDMLFKSLSTQNRTEHLAHLLSNDNSLGHMKNAIDDNLEDNSFDHRKHPIDHDPKDDSLDHTEFSIEHNSKKNDSIDHAEFSIDQNLEKNDSLDHEHLIDHSSKDNSRDHVEHSIDHDSKNNSLEDIKHFIGHNPENNSSDHNEHSFDDQDKSLNVQDEDARDMDSDESSSEEHSLADDQIKNSDDSAQLVFIRPVVESKAIPVPLTFLRRIGFDIKNPNSHRPMTAQDMDIKFSLAEALKYLRTLDADDKLPASREKTVTRKTINQTESEKKKLPLITEREEYLNTLRQKIFEENS